MMEKFKGTPGPWFKGKYGGVGGSGIFVGANQSPDGCHYVCEMRFSKFVPDDEVAANANIIAAAPDLLDALIQLHGCSKLVFFESPSFHPVKLAEAAINKALGVK